MSTSKDPPGLKNNSKDPPGFKNNYDDLQGLKNNPKDPPGLKNNSKQILVAFEKTREQEIKDVFLNKDILIDKSKEELESLSDSMFSSQKDLPSLKNNYDELQGLKNNPKNPPENDKQSLMKNTIEFSNNNENSISGITEFSEKMTSPSNDGKKNKNPLKRLANLLKNKKKGKKPSQNKR